MMRNDAMVENLNTQDNQDTINQGPGQ